MSYDDTQILNYTQWENKEDWNNAIHNKKVLSHPKHPFKYAKLDIQYYEVYHTFNKTL